MEPVIHMATLASACSPWLNWANSGQASELLVELLDNDVCLPFLPEPLGWSGGLCRSLTACAPAPRLHTIHLVAASGVTVAVGKPCLLGVTPLPPVHFVLSFQALLPARPFQAVNPQSNSLVLDPAIICSSDYLPFICPSEHMGMAKSHSVETGWQRGE